MNPCDETKEEFIKRYEKQNKLDFETHIVMRCNCDEGGGPTHWASIPKEFSLIQHHIDFNAPKGTPWPDGVPRE